MVRKTLIPSPKATPISWLRKFAGQFSKHWRLSLLVLIAVSLTGWFVLNSKPTQQASMPVVVVITPTPAITTTQVAQPTNTPTNTVEQGTTIKTTSSQTYAYTGIKEPKAPGAYAWRSADAYKKASDKKYFVCSIVSKKGTMLIRFVFENESVTFPGGTSEGCYIVPNETEAHLKMVELIALAHDWIEQDKIHNRVWLDPDYTGGWLTDMQKYVIAYP